MDHGMGLAGMRTGKMHPKENRSLQFLTIRFLMRVKLDLEKNLFPHHKIEDASIPPYHPNIPETRGIGLSIMQISLS